MALPGSSRARTLDTAGPHPAAAGGAPLRRWLITAAWIAVTLAGFAAYLRLARTRPVNSDGASMALQAWDMLHGNPLLRGWTLTDVTFYTTELPQYMLVELVRGLGADVVHVAAAMTYTLAVLFAALLAKGTATGREAAVRVALAAGIMLAPQLDSGTNVLISSPDHIGTSVPLLAVWLILDRARPRWYVPVITSLLLGLGPGRRHAGVRRRRRPAGAGLRVPGTPRDDHGRPGHAQGRARARPPGGAGSARRPLTARLAAQWYEIALAGGAIVAAVVAQLVPRIIQAAGGYTIHPLNTQLTSVGEIIRHLPVVGQGLLLLLGADFIGQPKSTTTFFIMLHVVGVALAACGIAVAAWRFFRDDRVSQVLLAGIVVNVVTFAASRHVAGLPSAREVAPALPFAAALAGRELARPLTAIRLARRALLPALGVVLVGYLAGLGLEISKPAVPPQAQQLTSWLEHHHLGTGLSGYWESNVVTLTSGERVAVHLVDPGSGVLIRGRSEVNAAWYDPARSSADFVVLFPGINGFPGFTNRKLGARHLRQARTDLPRRPLHDPVLAQEPAHRPALTALEPAATEARLERPPFTPVTTDLSRRLMVAANLPGATGHLLLPQS